MRAHPPRPPKPLRQAIRRTTAIEPLTLLTPLAAVLLLVFALAPHLLPPASPSVTLNLIIADPTTLIFAIAGGVLLLISPLIWHLASRARQQLYVLETANRN